MMTRPRSAAIALSPLGLILLSVRNSCSARAFRFQPWPPRTAAGSVCVPRQVCRDVGTRPDDRAVPAQSRRWNATLPPATRSVARKTERLEQIIAERGLERHHRRNTPHDEEAHLQPVARPATGTTATSRPS